MRYINLRFTLLYLLYLPGMWLVYAEYTTQPSTQQTVQH